MTKKYKAANLSYTVNIKDVIMVAILAKDWSANDVPKMEAWVIDISNEN